MTVPAVRQRRRVVCVEEAFGAGLPRGAEFSRNDGLRGLARDAADVRMVAGLLRSARLAGRARRGP